MELSHYERQMLSSLSQHAGFKLLLDSLQADADDLLDAIEFAEDQDKEKRLVANWRAMRHTIGALKLRTEPPELDESVEKELAGLHAVTHGLPNFGRMVTGEEE